MCAGKLPVDATPLTAMTTRWERVSITRPGPTLLRIEPYRRTFIYSLAIAALTALATLPPAFRFLLGSRATVDPNSLLAGSVILIVSLGAASLCRSFTFDLGTAVFSATRWFGSTTRPIADIKAIQLITGRYHACERDSISTGYTSYLLNLVLQVEGELTRMLLTDAGQLDSVRAAAVELAGFLNLPLVDTSA